MNRPDVTILLRRISVLFGRRHADADTIDEWHRQLQSYDAQEVFAALDRIIATGEGGPHIGRLIAEIRAHRPMPSTEQPPELDEPVLDPAVIRRIIAENIGIGRAEHLLDLERTDPDAATRMRRHRTMFR